MNQQQLERFCDYLSDHVNFKIQKKKVKKAIKNIVKTMSPKQISDGISYCNSQIARMINDPTYYSIPTAIVLQMYCDCLESSQCFC